MNETKTQTTQSGATTPFPGCSTTEWGEKAPTGGGPRAEEQIGRLGVNSDEEKPIRDSEVREGLNFHLSGTLAHVELNQDACGA